MNKLTVAALSFIAARSRRLRRMIPFLPVAIALYEAWKHHKAKQLAPQAYPDRPGAYSRRAPMSSPATSFR